VSINPRLPPPALPQTATVVRNVNLRADPSTTQDAITKLEAGAKVEILEPNPVRGFYHVQTADGKTGFVWGRNIRSLGAASGRSCPLLGPWRQLPQRFQRRGSQCPSWRSDTPQIGGSCLSSTPRLFRDVPPRNAVASLEDRSKHINPSASNLSMPAASTMLCKRGAIAWGFPFRSSSSDLRRGLQRLIVLRDLERSVLRRP